MYCQINFIVIIVSLIVIWMSLCLSHLNLISSQPDLSVNFYQRVLKLFLKLGILYQSLDQLDL